MWVKNFDELIINLSSDSTVILHSSKFICLCASVMGFCYGTSVSFMYCWNLEMWCKLSQVLIDMDANRFALEMAKENLEMYFTWCACIHLKKGLELPVVVLTTCMWCVPCTVHVSVASWHACQRLHEHDRTFPAQCHTSCTYVRTRMARDWNEIA